MLAFNLHSTSVHRLTHTRLAAARTLPVTSVRRGSTITRVASIAPTETRRLKDAQGFVLNEVSLIIFKKYSNQIYVIALSGNCRPSLLQRQLNWLPHTTYPSNRSPSRCSFWTTSTTHGSV
jgi:hypothetical protein